MFSSKKNPHETPVPSLLHRPFSRRAFLAASALPFAARAAAPPPPGAEAYLATPDFQPYAGPKGRMEYFVLDGSKIFPGFRHWCGVYLPNPHWTAGRAPALMVFQDGMEFANPHSPWRTQDVIDNLIGAGAIPPMIVVFVTPGFLPGVTQPLQDRLRQRSIEYDTLSPAYGDFLMNEILPRAAQYGAWSADPSLHGIGGHSSGAICAFTVAWNRPDMFRKVFSANGSFTNIRGGDKYPAIVAAGPKRPLRIYQWSDTHDMSRPDWGDWATANKAMAAALDAAGYDHKFEFGEGTHNPVYAAPRFPGALRWLWRPA